MKTYLLQAFWLGLVFVSCQPNNEKSMSSENQQSDPHSFSQPQIARGTHLNLHLKVDFEKNKLSGYAEYDMEIAEGGSEIIFDTEKLDIQNVSVDGKEVKFELGEEDAFLGQALIIPVNNESKKVRIDYETSAEARALQWLNPEQTAQKEKPFLFTQSQAILARSWIPCQDSPGIRCTYSADIEVPSGFMALMSAENPTTLSDDGKYHFEMPQPIPSYLMALTAGGIEFKEIGDRTGVYAEPVMLEKCHNEFSEMDDMLVAAEKLYGEYAWGRYDVIVLPPSFPFGGMENPRLTFATPTIIAGDKSLTSLVAHELAHSWSGNLVTNATWDDFWLNEGFTVYFEQRIMEEVYGRDYSEMLALLSFEGLKEEVHEMLKEAPNDTKLKLDLNGRDPDDGMNAIAYDKGYLLLRKIEETAGRENFDSFLKNYFTENAFKVMDTEKFLTYLKDFLSEEQWQTVGVDKWVYEQGLPENHPVISSDRFLKVENQMNNWLDGGELSEMDTENWTTHEWLHFINSLPDNLSVERIKSLDDTFSLTNSGNSEILAAWFQVTIRGKYIEADPAVEQFLTTVGRRKFLTPTYKALIERDPSKEMARNIYQKARPNYHSVSTGTIDELLDWKS